MHGETPYGEADTRLVEFDATTARLTADVDTFFALADAATAPADRPTARDPRCEEAGVMLDGLVHPALRSGLGTMDEPCARLEVEMSTPYGAWLHQGWLDHVSTLLVDRGDGTHDFVEVDVEFLPTALARLTDLRPRPRLEGRGGRIADVVLDGLLSSEARTRERAAEAAAGAALAWPAVAACLRSGQWQAVGLDVARPLGRSTTTRRVAWLDTPAGLVVVDGDRVEHLVGATVTEVWRALQRALPSTMRLDALTISA